MITLDRGRRRGSRRLVKSKTHNHSNHQPAGHRQWQSAWCRFTAGSRCARACASREQVVHTNETLVPCVAENSAPGKQHARQANDEHANEHVDHAREATLARDRVEARRESRCGHVGDCLARGNDSQSCALAFCRVCQREARSNHGKAARSISISIRKVQSAHKSSMQQLESVWRASRPALSASWHHKPPQVTRTLEQTGRPEQRRETSSLWTEPRCRRNKRQDPWKGRS